MKLLMVVVLVAIFLVWGTREDGAEEMPIQTFNGETKHATAHPWDDSGSDCIWPKYQISLS